MCDDDDHVAVCKLIRFLSQPFTVAVINSYVTEYFVENHGNKVPSHWWNALDALSPQQMLQLTIGQIPTKEESENAAWPDDMKAYFAELEEMTKLAALQPQHHFTDAVLTSTLSRGLNPKKCHEVAVFSEFIGELKACGVVSWIIDIGGGQGQLARALALSKGFNVITLDGSSCNSDAVGTNMSKVASATAEQVLAKTIYISSDIRVEEFMHVIKEVDISQSMIVGLHTCGDLATTVLRLFVETGAAAMALITCCYHKITPKILHVQGQDQQKEGCFPVSRCVISSGFCLSALGLELACHGNEKTKATVTFDNEHSIRQRLNANGMRATMQLYLRQHFPEIFAHDRRPNVGQLSSASSFGSYAVTCLSKLKLPLADISELEAYARPFSSQWHRVAIFYGLRAMLAPLIERVLLLDRVLYLKEHGISGKVTPLFNASTSPRNLMIFASRNLDLTQRAYNKLNN